MPSGTPKDVTLCYKVGGQPAFFMAETGWPAAPRAVAHRARPVRNRFVWPEAGAVSVDERLWSCARVTLADEDLELDDLVVAGRGPRVMKIIIDGEGGVGVDRLASASRGISRLLDEVDPFDGPYSLEGDLAGSGAEAAAAPPLREVGGAGGHGQDRRGGGREPAPSGGVGVGERRRLRFEDGRRRAEDLIRAGAFGPDQIRVEEDT